LTGLCNARLASTAKDTVVAFSLASVGTILGTLVAWRVFGALLGLEGSKVRTPPPLFLALTTLSVHLTATRSRKVRVGGSETWLIYDGGGLTQVHVLAGICLPLPPFVHCFSAIMSNHIAPKIYLCSLDTLRTWQLFFFSVSHSHC